MKRIRFKNTKRFSPVIYENDLPWEEDYFHVGYNNITKEILESNEYVCDELWWWKQRDRCLNGYVVENAIEEGGDHYQLGVDYVETEEGLYFKDLDVYIQNKNVYITGKHYFYLNFWKIKRKMDNEDRKQILNPKFIDLSWENWHIRERMRKEKKDNLFAKRRQGGFSEEEACDTMYEFIFYNNSQNVITAGEEKYSENLMNFCKRGFARLKHTQFYKELMRGGDRSDYMKSHVNDSELYMRTCKNNPQAVSSLSPSKITYEEVGIWKRGLVRATREAINPSIEAEGYKTGYQTFIGTGGDMADGVADMEEMTYKPWAYNLLEFENRYTRDGIPTETSIARFVPAWKFEEIDKDGNSLKTKSIIKLEKEREQTLPADRYTKIVMKPIYLEEIFMIPDGGYFGKEIAMLCNERKAYINNHKVAQVVKRINIEWVDPNDFSKGVEWKYDEEGRFLISEPPELDKDDKVYKGLYKAGTDSYDQDEANCSTSKGCCVIKKGFLDASHSANKHVAIILERPDTSKGGSELFYEDTAKLCMMYGARNLIEYSKILIFSWYERHNLTFLLKERPTFVTSNLIVDSKASNRWGIDPSTKSDWLVMEKDYLKVRQNIEQCDFVILLDAWGKFRYNPGVGKYNCDITIATSLCEVHQQDDYGVVIYNKNETIKRNDFFGYKVNKDGNLIQA